MTTPENETAKTSSEHPERRASDAAPGYFTNATLTLAAFPHEAFDGAHVESIDLDATLPPGHDHGEQFRPTAAAADKEQLKARLQVSRFKGAFDDFDTSLLTRVGISDVRRGDVIAIQTIVGTVYFRVVDRIRGVVGDSGEILCECRYDLPDQWSLVHSASIVLPICTKDHVIVNPDGSRRNASRALKMSTDAELPEQVRSLMRESFFTGITVHATPQKERLRPIDVFRGLQRLLSRLRKR